jgi:hypothetical protein
MSHVVLLAPAREVVVAVAAVCLIRHKSFSTSCHQSGLQASNKAAPDGLSSCVPKMPSQRNEQDGNNNQQSG